MNTVIPRIKGNFYPWTVIASPLSARSPSLDASENTVHKPNLFAFANTTPLSPELLAWKDAKGQEILSIPHPDTKGPEDIIVQYAYRVVYSMPVLPIILRHKRMNVTRREHFHAGNSVQDWSIEKLCQEEYTREYTNSGSRQKRFMLLNLQPYLDWHYVFDFTLEGPLGCWMEEEEKQWNWGLFPSKHKFLVKDTKIRIHARTKDRVFYPPTPNTSSGTLCTGDMGKSMAECIKNPLGILTGLQYWLSMYFQQAPNSDLSDSTTSQFLSSLQECGNQSLRIPKEILAEITKNWEISALDLPGPELEPMT